MPLLPLKALRRGQREQRDEEEGDAGGRRRVTRGVTLAPAISEPTPATPAAEAKLGGIAAGRSKSLQPTPTIDVPLTPGAAESHHRPRLSMPHILMTPSRSHVRWAPSPQNTSTEVTPYARVYGVHPAFFDFDHNGTMQPTQAGAYEMQRGALCLTPSVKGRMALIVQGTQSPSGSSSVGSPVCTSPMACWSMTPTTSRSPKADMPYALGEQVLVLTDDGKAWMDAQVVAVFPVDTEAEGYSVPGGTVKVSYELGIKWVMPQNISGTLRKKMMPSFNSYAPTPRHHPFGFVQVPTPQAASAWQVYPGHVAYTGRAV